MILNDDERKTAFQRTADVLRGCDQIRLNLGLPSELLGRILDVHIAATREVLVEKDQAALAARWLRAPMTMNSSDEHRRPFRILRGLPPVQVIAQPQWLGYRVEEIEISGDPSHWRVHDIRIGNVPQCPNSLEVPIPGERFCKGGIMSNLRLEVCQTAMWFVLAVEYVGPLDEGAVFEATLVGTALR